LCGECSAAKTTRARDPGRLPTWLGEHGYNSMRTVNHVSAKRIIPVTPIWQRYQELRGMPQKQRLAQAWQLVEQPEELATELLASVVAFTPYENAEERFYPPPRVQRQFAEHIKRTNDVVLRLEAQGHLEPTDAPERLSEHDADQTVTAVPAARMACDYVDRELLVQRTASPAEWSDGRRNIGGLRLDLVLADSADRTPIVGELKLPGDMDPFFALIQALACAAHLATPNQFDRMRRHLSRGRFAELAAPPRLDIWLLFLDEPSYESGQERKGR
jgi:hypothetical protein